MQPSAGGEAVHAGGGPSVTGGPHMADLARALFLVIPQMGKERPVRAALVAVGVSAKDTMVFHLTGRERAPRQRSAAGGAVAPAEEEGGEARGEAGGRGGRGDRPRRRAATQGSQDPLKGRTS